MTYLDHHLWTYRDSGGIKRTVFDFVFDFRKYVFVISKQIDTASFKDSSTAFEGRRRIKGGQVCEGGLTPLSPAEEKLKRCHSVTCAYFELQRST